MSGWSSRMSARSLTFNSETLESQKKLLDRSVDQGLGLLKNGKIKEGQKVIEDATVAYDSLEVAESDKIAFRHDSAQQLFDAGCYDAAIQLDEDTLFRLSSSEEYGHDHQLTINVRHRFALGLSRRGEQDTAKDLHRDNEVILQNKPCQLLHDTYEELAKIHRANGNGHSAAKYDGLANALQRQLDENILRDELHKIQSLVFAGKAMIHQNVASATSMLQKASDIISKSSFQSDERLVAIKTECDLWLERCRAAVVPGNLDNENNSPGIGRATTFKSQQKNVGKRHAEEPLQPTQSTPVTIHTEARVRPQRVLTTSLSETGPKIIEHIQKLENRSPASRDAAGSIENTPDHGTSQAHISDIPNDQSQFQTVQNDTNVNTGHLMAGGRRTAANKADEWFRELRNKTHNFMYGSKNQFKSCIVNNREYDRVKVAVLDTGLAMLPHQEPSTLVSIHRDRIKEYESFIDFSKSIQDDDGHGTHVALLLLQTCPNADLYVARVVKSHKEAPKPEDVSKAIEHAIKKWKVDIITLSLGWKSEYTVVEKALLQAQLSGVLVFASTSNEGAGSGTSYPAVASNVISVDAADGHGKPYDSNPGWTSKVKMNVDRLTAPGEDVESAWPLEPKDRIGFRRQTGTSFATPIAAGIAALMLEFARQPPLGHERGICHELKKTDKMYTILHEFCSNKASTTNVFRFLKPAEYFNSDGHVELPGLEDAYTSGSPRREKAGAIITTLNSIKAGVGKMVYEKIDEHNKQRILAHQAADPIATKSR